MKTRKTLSLLALISLIPILPYLFVGYASHDLQFHLSSWMEVRDSWFSGRLWPGWDPLANFTLGDAHLLFYPPVSFILGAGLSVILPLRIAPGAFIAFVIFISGLTMYAASKYFVTENDRMKAAVLYMLSPYVLTTAIVRFAASELLVEAWLPLICLFFYRVIWHDDRRALLLLGCLLGLSWLTSVPGSIVMLYTLSIVAIVASIRRSRLYPILCFAVAEIIATPLAAFYLLPAWVEQKWITPSGLLKFSLREFMLFAPASTLTHKLFSVSCSIFACAGVVLVMIYVWTRDKESAGNQAMHTWWDIALVSFAFQLPITAFLWRRLPELLTVQFSYRFLLLLWAAVPLALFGKGTRRSMRLPSYAIIAILSFLPFLVVVRQQIPWSIYPRFATITSRWAQYGKLGAPEYVPRGLNGPAVPTDIPAASVVGDPSTSHCSVTPRLIGPALASVQTTSDAPCQLRLRTYFYPYWRALDESGRPLEVGRDKDGLLLLTLPAGTHTARLDFVPSSPLRTASLIVSLVSALLICILLLWLAKVPLPQEEGHLALVS